jgi:hypothetical protein
MSVDVQLGIGLFVVERVGGGQKVFDKVTVPEPCPEQSAGA